MSETYAKQGRENHGLPTLLQPGKPCGRAVDEYGLPSEKLCPRDAITREPIGWVDPDDPANNFYEYTIDENLCDGCGLCVMNCKEPLGLGSITLMVRHDRCVDCNRCAISTECPENAVVQLRVEEALEPTLAH